MLLIKVSLYFVRGDAKLPGVDIGGVSPWQFELMKFRQTFLALLHNVCDVLKGLYVQVEDTLHELGFAHGKLRFRNLGVNLSARRRGLVWSRFYNYKSRR